MLDALFQGEITLYMIIFAVVTPFLLLFFALKAGTFCAKKNVTLIEVLHRKRKEKSSVIASDPECVRIITHLAQLEMISDLPKPAAALKNKTRLMLRLRKRIRANFPDMTSKEVEAFCGHLHDLAKSVARKKIK